MSLFEFVTAIIAMIFALALGGLLRAVSALVKHRQQVKSYGPHLIWLICLLFFILNNWWSLWDFRDLGWTYPAFFYILIAPVLIFFGIDLLVPEISAEGRTDLRDHFRNVRQLFTLVMLTVLLAHWLEGPLLQGQAALGLLGLVHAAMIGLVLVSFFADSDWANLIAALGVLTVMVFVAGLRFLPGRIA